MISLKREDSASYIFMEALVEIRFKIPTGAESEELLDTMIPDSEVFKRFVLDVRSKDIEGWQNGISASDVVDSPATLALIRVVAKDIVDGMKKDATRKNS